MRNQEKFKAYQKKWRENNRDKMLWYHRFWRAKNKDKLKAIQKKYYDSHKEQEKEEHKQWKLKHPNYYTEYNHRPERIKYNKNYRNNPETKKRNNKKIIEWRKAHPENHKISYKKWELKAKDTPKYKARIMRKIQGRRKKFKEMIGLNYNEPTKELVEYIDNRDKVCIYCGKEFNGKSMNPSYWSYDHLNPNLPHSKINTVKCCISCNASKGNKKVLDWLQTKGLIPNPIINKLISNQNGLV